MTLLTFVWWVMIDDHRLWALNPSVFKALIFSAFAVDMSLVAFLIAWGVIL